MLPYVNDLLRKQQASGAWVLMYPPLSFLPLLLILPRHEPLVQERHQDQHRGEAM
jgi:hypothetical protein